MCWRCEDLNRTVLMLGDLCLYAEHPAADQHFTDIVGAGLALSLPVDIAPPGYGLPPLDDGDGEC
nr:hypothetical protein [Streptomyces apocyni]